MKPWLAVVLALAAVTGGSASAEGRDRWTARKADRYLELNYRNVLQAHCRGTSRRSRGNRYTRFGCGLIYTDMSLGTAGLAPITPDYGYVVFFS